MFYFLTSSLLKGRSPMLDDANDLADEIAYRCRGERKGLFICASPASYEGNDRFGNTVRAALENGEIVLGSYDILDGRNERDAAELVGRRTSSIRRLLPVLSSHAAKDAAPT